ncbi:MAG: hypothetical protein ABI859_05120 [Pseudomonadota bacterium]
MAGIPLVAMTFWLVIFGISALGIWSGISRERERQQTIRSAIERGQQLDPAVLEKVMARPAWQEKADGGKEPWVQLMVGAIITLSVGPGLMFMGFLLGKAAPLAYWPLMGAGALVGTLGSGMVVAALVWRRYSANDHTQL